MSHNDKTLWEQTCHCQLVVRELIPDQTLHNTLIALCTKLNMKKLFSCVCDSTLFILRLSFRFGTCWSSLYAMLLCSSLWGVFCSCISAHHFVYQFWFSVMQFPRRCCSGRPPDLLLMTQMRSMRSAAVTLMMSQRQKGRGRIRGRVIKVEGALLHQKRMHGWLVSDSLMLEHWRH